MNVARTGLESLCLLGIVSEMHSGPLLLFLSLGLVLNKRYFPGLHSKALVWIFGLYYTVFCFWWYRVSSRGSLSRFGTEVRVAVLSLALSRASC